MHANATLALMRRHPEKFQTITSDNGTEFHGYAQKRDASGTVTITSEGIRKRSSPSSTST